jgi:hypothetical protein
MPVARSPACCPLQPHGFTFATCRHQACWSSSGIVQGRTRLKGTGLPPFEFTYSQSLSLTDNE